MLHRCLVCFSVHLSVFLTSRFLFKLLIFLTIVSDAVDPNKEVTAADYELPFSWPEGCIDVDKANPPSDRVGPIGHRQQHS